MQAAVDHQLKQMSERNPQRHVGLVTFGSEVQIIGDGTTDVLTIAGDRLNNRADIVAAVEARDNCISRDIKSTSQALSAKLFALEENGSTALGPALLASITLASKRPGSHVILCTDGLANKGLGDLDSTDDALLTQAEAFYTDMANLARDKGVIVSVISIEGQECRLENLGAVAEATGGEVNKVNPLKLLENFSSILAKPILATNVNVTLQLHSGLYFRNEPAITSKVSRDLGNVNEDSETSFEFGLRPEFMAQVAAVNTTPNPAPAPQAAPADEEAAVPAPPQPAATPALPTTLPFQLQIRFTRPDGNKMMRVITKSKPITSDRTEAEKARGLGY